MRRLALAAGVLSAAALALAACSSDPVGTGSDDESTEATTGTTQTTDAETGGDDEASEAPQASGDEFLAQARELVEAASGTGEGFTPPSGGPQAQSPGGTIVYIGADLTNGGINAVGEGVQEAADAIGWDLTILDGKASAQGRTEALSQAIAMQPEGIILGGFDAKEQASAIREATGLDIPVVGWHAGPEAGPMPEEGVFVNVTTDATEVAELAAAYVVADSDGTAGVAIFTDRQYEIAVAKSDAINDYIEQCAECTVFAYENSPIAEADSRMPSLISSLLQQHGDELTYLIGINGNYFGGAQSALRAAGIDGAGPPQGVAAGDGDAAEFQRIRNVDYQSATVAEPINLQGWQLVDELNRAVAGEEPSGFVALPGLITVGNVPSEGLFDPDSGYREIYTANWGG